MDADRARQYPPLGFHTLSEEAGMVCHSVQPVSTPPPTQHPTGGSFEARLAARNTPKPSSPLRQARYKVMPPSRLTTPQSRPGSYLTIPQGVSPATLLDSPVLLSTNQAEPSPTTGTFPLPSYCNGGVLRGSVPDHNEPGSEQGGGASFVFKPHAKAPGRNENGRLSSLAALIQPLGQFGGHNPLGQLPVRTESIPDAHAEEQIDDEGTSTSPVPEKAADDGYNWRKYGQKHVKGSNNPRSYYKCTHPGCPSKKKVECSLTGQVTDRVYKGVHNHPQPTPSRRVSVSHNTGGLGEDDDEKHNSGLSLSLNMAEGTRNAAGDASSRSKSSGLATRADQHGADDGRESFTLSMSIDTEKHGGIGALRGDGQCTKGAPPEGMEGFGKRLRAQDRFGADSKKRKSDARRESATNNASKQIREPRLVIQAQSDVDILDDGYRWRKYGQKVVKGNPHPRSYYKCTHPGCPVRKHVERSSSDAKEVITTYEGKHSHDVPAARTVKEDAAGLAAGSASSPLTGAESSVVTTNTDTPNVAKLSTSNAGSTPTTASPVPTPMSNLAEQAVAFRIKGDHPDGHLTAEGFGGSFRFGTAAECSDDVGNDSDDSEEFVEAEEELLLSSEHGNEAGMNLQHGDTVVGQPGPPSFDHYARPTLASNPF